MNITFSELKRQAQKSLLGHYKTPCYAFLLTVLLTLLLTLGLEAVSGGTAAISGETAAISGFRPVQYAIYYLASFFIGILAVLLQCGLCKIHLNIAAGQPVSNKDLFHAFRFNSDRMILASIRFVLVWLFCALPAGIYNIYLVYTGNESTAGKFIYCLLWGAGFIVSLFYFLTFAFVFFLLLENPDMAVHDAFVKSRSLMKGYKWKLFLLTLSFIGWFLLGILSLFAGFIWIMPYIMQTYVNLYKVRTASVMDSSV